MCGIAGIMYKGKLLGTGQALIDMLDGCQHRGPDSTGFALYGRAEEGTAPAALPSVEDEEADAAIARIAEALAEHGAEVVEERTSGTTTR